MAPSTSANDISVTDARHRLFLQWHGVTAYNNYFNRDKKRTILEPIVDLLNIPPPKPMACTQYSLEPCDEHFDIFYDEFRDGDNAVPVPVEMEYRLVEPLESHYRFVPLEYIQEHGVLEFILESQYCYSACSLLHYGKAAEYQMIYLHKLIREGRLTRDGKVVSCVQIDCNLDVTTVTAEYYR